MKKPLCWLLLALQLVGLTAPAQAGKFRVVVPHWMDTSSQGSIMFWDNFVNNCAHMLDELGVDYDMVRQDAVNSGPQKPAARLSQAGIRDSVFVDDLGRTQTYVGQMLLGWSVGGSNWKTAGYNPDTLTLAASWPQIPTAFLGQHRTIGGSVYNSTAACSTGVVGASLTFSGVFGFETSNWIPGADLVWKGGNPYYRRDANGFKLTAGAPGVLRNRIAVASSVASYGAFPTRNCDDCDAFPPGVRIESQSLADTSWMWERRLPHKPNAPLIFAPTIYCSNSGLDYPTMMFAMVVAALDSASGGRIIGQKAGWQPKKIAIGIDNALVHGISNGNGDDPYYHGLNPRDSVYLYAHLDSLKRLNIPLTVWVNTDSLDQYPVEASRWADLPTARYAPTPRRGLGSGFGEWGASGNASASNPVDPYGLIRARIPITIDNLNNGTPCDGVDTTMSCLLEYARAKLDGNPLFKGRMSNALLAQFSDYVPSNMTARDLQGSYTANIEAAMLRAGYNVALVGVTAWGLNPSANYAFGAGFPVQLTGNIGGVRGIGVGVRSSPVYGTTSSVVTPAGQTVYATSGSAKIGDFRWGGFRPLDGPVTSTSDETGAHPLPDEFFQGLWTDNWYPNTIADNTNRSNFYYHTFRTRLNAVIVRPGDLGSTDAAGARVQQQGWWYVKHVVNASRALNYIAGRTIVKFVYADEL